MKHVRKDELMSRAGLYIHVPFCDGKCSYCVFYSVRHKPYMAARYLSAVELELKSLIESFPDFEPETIYLGGGTPTVLGEEHLERLCGMVAGNVRTSRLKEWTVEANPGTLNRRKLRVLREAGVNRVSVGAQSFSDDVLRQLGRRHSAADILRAVDMVREAGFTNLGLDLIACVPGVDRKTWGKTLDEALRLEPEHVSVYALTVEEGTALSRMAASGGLRVHTDDEQLGLLHFAEKKLDMAGYRRYEISNYALPGFECLHNLSCWRGCEYLGLGPGASSYRRRRRWTNTPDLDAYLSELEKGLFPPRDEEKLSSETLAAEMLVFGLRMADGVDLDLIGRLADIPPSRKKKWVEVLSGLSENNLAVCCKTRWKLTDRGRDLADYIAVELME